MTPLVSLLFFVPLIAFYLWMFRDMTNNEVLSPDERYTWTMAFILLDIFAAGMYFMQYKRRY
jgi:hypothetical protein